MLGAEDADLGGELGKRRVCIQQKRVRSVIKMNGHVRQSRHVRVYIVHDRPRSDN